MVNFQPRQIGSNSIKVTQLWGSSCSEVTTTLENENPLHSTFGLCAHISVQCNKICVYSSSWYKIRDELCSFVSRRVT